MRRRLLILAVFLLAGVVMNVAVAWGCAAWLEGGDLYDRMWIEGLSAPDAPCWAVSIERRAASTVVAFSRWVPEPPDEYVFRGREDFQSLLMWHYKRGAYEAGAWPSGPHPEVVVEAPYWSRVRWSPPSSDGPRVNFVEDARGWPARSLVGYFDHEPGFQAPPTAAAGAAMGQVIGPTHRLFLEEDQWPDLPRGLPLRPISLGFAVNTLFYAAILWLLIPGPFVLRRFVRVKRGLCPGCAYPRGESDVCSECGKARA